MKNISKPGEASKSGLPWHAWLFGGVLLLYSLAAAFDYVMSMVQGADFYRASGMSESQVDYFLNVPGWAVIGWTISVWGGLLGAVALLATHRFAAGSFFVSLTGSLIYILYVLVLSAGREAMGVIWFMPIVIAAITAVIVFYCEHLRRLGILN
jgi:hypothetical protein